MHGGEGTRTAGSDLRNGCDNALWNAGWGADLGATPPHFPVTPRFVHNAVLQPRTTPTKRRTMGIRAEPLLLRTGSHYRARPERFVRWYQSPASSTLRQSAKPAARQVRGSLEATAAQIPPEDDS